MSQNFQKFAIFQKYQLENLVDFEKCCQTHIFLQKSEPIQPKTSNILPKFCQPTLSTAPRSRPRPRGPRAPSASRSGGFAGQARPRSSFSKMHFSKCIFRKCIFRKFCNFLAGPFSAVSKRNFARKYAFDSICQAPQDLHTFAPLQSQNFRKKSV